MARLKARAGRDASGYILPGHNAKRYRAPAPMGPFKYKIRGGKGVVDTYDRLHRAWRVGLIDDFYFRTRSDDDASLVWHVGALELEGADLAGVATELARLELEAGVVSYPWGATWCGYRAIYCTFLSGLSIVQEYADGAIREREVSAASELERVA